MALEFRQVVVPRVLAHLVERARDRAVVAAAALVALAQLPGVVLLEGLLADFDDFKKPLSLFTLILTFCFKSQIFDSHFSLNENAHFCHSHFVLTLIFL